MVITYLTLFMSGLFFGIAFSTSLQNEKLEQALLNIRDKAIVDNNQSLLEYVDFEMRRIK